MYYLSNRSQPDLIIIDPQLPDMEDWELIKHLSTSGLHGEIPVVVLSGLDVMETESRCVEYGAVRYFLKPFNPVELMDSIRDLVSTLVD
jgi:CheY-like chemotaxis protein